MIKDEINQIFQECFKQKYSDLFVMPYNDTYQLLFRDVNGYKKFEDITKEKALQMMSYLKYQADMAISEQRRPQDGSLVWHDAKNQLIHLRIATVGDFLERPSMVIRFIYDLQQKSVLDYKTKINLQRALKYRGLIVFSGPMGSGKTSLIYETARSLADHKLVMAIEDPVEIQEEQFLQLQVNEKSGMSYQNLLRSGLRSRPDIFIIGEIRDQKTAEIAIQAALSGHLVLTTIHAKNASGVYERLLELGIASEYLKEALTATIYQRLIPTVKDNLKIIADFKSFHPDLKIVEDSWQDKLKKWRDAGEITEAIYQEYQYG